MKSCHLLLEAGNSLHLQSRFSPPTHPAKVPLEAGFEGQRAQREGVFSGESVRGPEPRGVQGLTPILQKTQACGHRNA